MWSQKQQARLKVANAFEVCWAWFHGSVMGLITTEPCLAIVINRATRVRFPVGWVDAEQVSLLRCTALVDLGGGGVPGTRHPLRDPILLFSHTFSLKSACIGGPHPQRVHAPLREILDPPLYWTLLESVTHGCCDPSSLAEDYVTPSQ